MNRLHDILIRLLPMLLVLGVASCSSSEEPEPAPEDQAYRFGFYLSVGEVNDKAQSRAPSDGLYLPGEGYENYINLGGDDIRVVLYNTDDNSIIANITDFVVIPVESYGSSKRYYLHATTNSDISSGKFKLLVVANWKTYPAEMSLNNIWAQTYQYAGPVLSEVNTIPLFGIKECKLNNVVYNKELDLGTIHLLRSMAKIEVILKNGTRGDDTDGTPLPENEFWHFKYLRLSHYNKSGFCAPTGIDSEDGYKKDSWSQDYVPFVSIPENAAVGTNLEFEPTKKNHWVLYVPEYKNQESSNPAVINFDFAESNRGPKTITINDPDDDTKRADFKRNVWYRVTIYKNKEEDECVVDVIPYKLVNLEPIFGLDPEVTTETK